MAIELAANRAQTHEEDRLALRCRAGDLGAFDLLVERYQARLLRFAVRLLRDRSDAEDAVQEAFVRAYRALGAYRPDGFFSSWMYRITLNECRRRMRSSRPTVGLDTIAPMAAPIDLVAGAMIGERNRQLREAIDALPEHYRLVMVLFYFEEFSVEQISKALTVSVSAVKVRLHRARERLATRLSLTE